MVALATIAVGALVLMSAAGWDIVEGSSYDDDRPEVIALQPPIATAATLAMSLPAREQVGVSAQKQPVVKPITGAAKPLIPSEAVGVYTLPSAGNRLAYVPNSSARVEQVIGDSDRSTNKPTVNLTQKRYGIEGTDLGVSFEHKGKLYFLFGDTIGPVGGDAIAVSESTEPNLPLKLDFLEDKSTGHYLVVEPPAISMEGYETPVSGISVNGNIYVVIKSAYMPPFSENVATMLDALRRADSDLPGAALDFEPARRPLHHAEPAPGRRTDCRAGGRRAVGADVRLRRLPQQPRLPRRDARGDLRHGREHALLRRLRHAGPHLEHA